MPKENELKPTYLSDFQKCHYLLNEAYEKIFKVNKGIAWYLSLALIAINIDLMKGQNGKFFYEFCKFIYKNIMDYEPMDVEINEDFLN